jgi:hypothetical protein
MKLITPDKVIMQAIADHYAGVCARAAKKASPDILNRVRIVVQDAIQKSPEYESLLGGKLRGSLGVVDASAALSSALDIWLDQIFLSVNTFKASGSRITGGFSLYVIETDKSSVINLSDSTYTTEKGDEIPWMKWLLTAGDQTIIRDYIAITGDLSHIPQSRTGEGIMRYVPGRVYKVPAEYSGTEENNFVTRSLDRVVDVIASIMQEEFEYQFYAQ